MKKAHSESRQGRVRSNIHHRGVWPGLLLVAGWAVLPGLARPGQAAVPVQEAWVHRYSNVASNANDRASQIVRDPAGDIIVTGVTDDDIHAQDMITIKYSG